METANREMYPEDDPVTAELLHLYMDFQIRHQALLQEAALAENSGPAVEAATGVAMCIVRVMAALYARGYEFPE